MSSVRRVGALTPLVAGSRRVRLLGSAALSLCQVATGSASALVAPAGMRAYDCAAALLLLRESGAVTTDLDGRPLDGHPLDLSARLPLVTSLSPAVHERTLGLLTEGGRRVSALQSPAPTATLLISCPDQRGLVARTAQFVADRNGNLVHAEHHIDPSTGLFLMPHRVGARRLRARPRGDRPRLRPARRADPGALAAPLLRPAARRMAIWVSRQDHGLSDLIQRQRGGELRAEISLVLSNHQELWLLADAFGIEYVHVPTYGWTNRHRHEAVSSACSRTTPSTWWFWPSTCRSSPPSSWCGTRG